MLYITEEPKGAKLVDLLNESDAPMDAVAASITAAGVVRCDIAVDGERVDCVYAGNGGSHTWWTQGGNKLLPHGGLQPGQRLEITVDGPAALRIDWYDR